MHFINTPLEADLWYSSVPGATPDDFLMLDLVFRDALL
jgi:hypothetical protein